MTFLTSSSLSLRASGRSLLATCFTICILVLVTSASLEGQALSGIQGTVSDATGAVVPNAKLTVTNSATQVVSHTTSSTSGTYTVTDLIPGSYTVQVEMAGFQVSVHNGVLVEVGRQSTVDVTLQTGNVQQTVEVQEAALTLNTTQPELGTTIEPIVVESLPVQLDAGDGRGRQIDSFVFLAPGVTGGTFSKRINGGVDFQSEVVFNGVPMAQSETQGFQTIWNPPFEQVHEFNVLRSSFSAQYGLAQGVVTYQTASGTNQFHGDGFEIVRNNFFDARGAYNPTVPIDRENNYGFTIGGPIILPKLYNGKNRLFFHLSMEWYRRNNTDTNFMSLPTAAEKLGDFSATGVTIFDPKTGQPFAGNKIPSSRFSPLSSTLIPLMPDPASAGFSNNFQSNIGVIPTRQNPWGFNIDYNISDKQSIHWSEWRDKQTAYGTETSSHLTGPLGSRIFQPDLGTVFILSYSNAITPHLVMTAGASWLGELNDQISLNKNENFPAAPGAPQLPQIHFTGPLAPTDFGSNWIQSINRKLGWVIENNYLWIKGRHTFNIGMEIRRTYQDDNECQHCAGSFNFSNNQTADPNNLGTTGNAFASFLLGSVDSANRVGSPELRLRNRDFSPYIQDDIKIKPNFTINIGLRWDIMVPFTEVNNQIVFFDSKASNPGAGGLLGAASKFGDCAGCAGFTQADTRKNHISPRFGFSYGLNNKTVIQGGISQNYLDGGAYEYGTAKVAVNYANLLTGSFNRNSTGTTTAAFGSWDSNVLPLPAPVPFSPSLGIGQQIDGFSRNDGRAPYVIAWNIGIQRELPDDILVSAHYVGNRGNHLPGQLNVINQLSPSFLSLGSVLGLQVNDPAAIAAGVKIPYANFLNDFGSSATVLQALRPYPQFANIFDNFDDSGSSLYNALQVQLEKRFSKGLSFLVTYNLSKMMSSSNSGFTSFVANSLNKNNQKAEWSLDNNDQTNAITIAGVYELPIGKGKAYLNNPGIASNIVGGWKISPILQYSTGAPIWSGGPGGSVVAPGDPLGNLCAPCNRANVVAGAQQEFSYSNVYKGLPVLNAAAFTAPGLWTLGTAGRVLNMRLPWNLNENVSLSKKFSFTERISAELRFSYFNLLNRVILGGPNTLLTDPNFGRVINSQANTQRQGQAQFQLNF
jgi:Carboxypeptidase regulatory-like domain